MHIVFVSDFLFFNVETHFQFVCMLHVIYRSYFSFVVIKHPYVFEIFSPF